MTWLMRMMMWRRNCRIDVVAVVGAVVPCWFLISPVQLMLLCEVL